MKITAYASSSRRSRRPHIWVTRLEGQYICFSTNDEMEGGFDVGLCVQVCRAVANQRSLTWLVTILCRSRARDRTLHVGNRGGAYRHKLCSDGESHVRRIFIPDDISIPTSDGATRSRLRAQRVLTAPTRATLVDDDTLQSK